MEDADIIVIRSEDGGKRTALLDGTTAGRVWLKEVAWVDIPEPRLFTTERANRFIIQAIDEGMTIRRRS
jgi:hypothetical protein